tara:strand:+ start:4037 stop:4381 length:345 start_codon:yes stop_codon:yes gene_type:complete
MAYTGKHQGLREFSGDEIGQVSLGQMGFDLCENTTIEAGDSNHPEVNYWVAIKAINSASGAATVKARSVLPGDDFAVGGNYANATLELAPGDIIYGAFDKITVTTDKVLCYRGK